MILGIEVLQVFFFRILFFLEHDLVYQCSSLDLCKLILQPVLEMALLTLCEDKFKSSACLSKEQL